MKLKITLFAMMLVAGWLASPDPAGADQDLKLFADWYDEHLRELK
jgi:hypothetical protein